MSHKGKSNSEGLAKESTYKRKTTVVKPSPKIVEKENNEVVIHHSEDGLVDQVHEFKKDKIPEKAKDNTSEINETTIVKDTLKKLPNYDGSGDYLKTSKILTFTSLLFPIPTFILGWFSFWGNLNFGLFWPIGLVAGGAITLIFSIWYIISAAKNKSRRNIVGGVLMLFLSLLAIAI